MGKLDAVVELQNETAKAVTVAESSLAHQQQTTLELQEKLDDLDWKFVEYLQQNRHQALNHHVFGGHQQDSLKKQLSQMYYGSAFIVWCARHGVAWRNSEFAAQAVTMAADHIKRRRQGIVTT